MKNINFKKTRRPRIKRQTASEKLAKKLQEVRGLSPKQAWSRVRELTFKSEMEFVTQQYAV